MEHLLVTGVKQAKVGAKIIEIKDKGEVIDKQIITTLTLEIDGPPGQCDELMAHLAADNSVQLTCDSPQMAFKMD